MSELAGVHAASNGTISINSECCRRSSCFGPEHVDERLMRRLGFTVAILLLITGCARLPKDYVREPSSAWDRPQETRLGRELAGDLQEHLGLSGFHRLSSGMDAFVARMALADVAEHTLDLQYYIFHGDLTGKLLLERLMQAADRGVRVRLLIDDIGTSADDAFVAAFSSHPNIEVRIFNPVAGRSGIARLFSFATEFSRVNRRMHNKMFVADNIVGVAGGRNIGDEYFGARKDVNFADIDILAVGTVVSDMSESFDEYWSSEWAVPVVAFVPKKLRMQDLEDVRERLEENLRSAESSDYAERLRESDLMKRLQAGELPLVWASAQIVADQPEKAGNGGKEDSSVRLGPQLQAAVTEVRSELIITSPYFVPGKSGMELFKKLRERGVRIRVLTNSFAANDVAIVHRGYSRYRKDLLKLGVELYELKPVVSADGEREKKRRSLFGSSGASLHAKSFVFDRKQLFVGSLNLDPRSLYLNTELGIVVNSPELAAEMATTFEEIVGPQYSYRVTLDEDNDLVWTAEEGGKDVRYTKDPEVGLWRRFSTSVLSLFAPESML